MVTKEQLKQYRNLVKESADLEKRIQRTRECLSMLEKQGNVIDSVSGGYGGTQHFRIEGFPVTEYSAKKTRMLSQMLRYEQNMKTLAEITEKIGVFIDNIPDARDRMIFRFYYEDGMSQKNISKQVGLDQTVISRILDRYSVQ